MPATKDDIQLRSSFKFLLLENPNYFGNLGDTNLKSLGKTKTKKKIGDTTFEKLTCVSYNPETAELGATVCVKQQSGYLGGPCTDGSKEYVRFYLDYGDGTWVDHGAVNFDAHDLPFKERLCYAVKQVITPKRRTCCDRDPVLPRVRAILSWNVEPPANQPNWMPVWGNRLEADIQIEPRHDLLCKITGIDVGLKVDPEVMAKLADMVELEKPVPPKPPVSLLEQKKYYAEKGVEDERFGHKAMYQLAADPTDVKAHEQALALKAAGLDIAKVVEFEKAPNFNTSYEELHCISLDRDESALHADILVKKPYGYAGDLCTDGSRQYVAFYMDFGAGWVYMGTSSVGVHDIPEITPDGLWYLAKLPVSLTKWQQAWCDAGKAELRGILSWNIAPPANDPDYVAHWGDWEECTVEVRPLPPGVQIGQVVPVIESVGSMPISLINASGYANGTNSVGLTAHDSPFDGNIRISGIIANAPDSSTPGIDQLKYRLMVKEPSSATFQPVTKKFTIFVTTIASGVPGPQVAVDQIPDADGWVSYHPDFMAPVIVSVDSNVLGIFRPSEEGLHKVKVEVDDPSAIPHIPSSEQAFMVDMTAPAVDVEITSGTGNCGNFTVGDVILGTYSMTDAHSLSLGLSVTPSDEANGQKPEIGGPGGPASLSYTAATLPGGGASGTWQLDTGPMDPCGFNIRIHGEDRTIVNSAAIGHEAWDIEGFCLKEA